MPSGRLVAVHWRRPLNAGQLKTVRIWLDAPGFPGPGGYPARAGGPWLCSTLVLFLFHALVVPSGLTTRVQPQR